MINTDVKKERLDVAKSLGAQYTVDISKVDNAVAAVRSLTENGRGADVALRQLVYQQCGRTQWLW